MWFFYLCCIIPISIGLYFLYKNKSVIWQEWVSGSLAAFLLAAICHGIAIIGMTNDVETWSGKVLKVSHHPEWVEHWVQTHSETYTSGTGNNQTTHTRTWTTDEYDTHYEHWIAHRDFGEIQDTIIIDKETYDYIAELFGNEIIKDGLQKFNKINGSFHKGDRNIYSVNNNTGYIVPTTTIKTFDNRIKASPTVFSFTKVPDDINVYDWPENNNWMYSERLLGTAKEFIDLYKFDCMNSYLGPFKKVNVIMIGFDNEGSEYGLWQQSKWIGGKKNDLVLCFGGATKTTKPQWAYVFGWTENEIVKKNLESILIDNIINDDILPLIQKEIYKNYVIKDWSKFDYISIDPPTWSYVVFIIALIISQTSFYVWFHKNEYNKCIWTL